MIRAKVLVVGNSESPKSGFAPKPNDVSVSSLSLSLPLSVSLFYPKLATISLHLKLLAKKQKLFKQLYLPLICLIRFNLSNFTPAPRFFEDHTKRTPPLPKLCASF